MAMSSEKIMGRALTLARRGMGKTSPNPAVGCVIVRDGAIVGEGWHRKAGTPHAEVHALRQAGELARGADVYVTLEPCSHFGKTPPCAEALVEAGVGRVFVGMVDPNPKVSGRGIERLRVAGIDVVTGIREAECRRLNEPFVKHVTTGLPFVILKSAMTMDGKTATASGDSRWITNEKSRRYVHKLRSMVDAIMVGVGTVLADDPQLTARIPRGKDPVRVVVDSSLRIPSGARMLHQESPVATVIATVSGDRNRIVGLESAGAEVLRCHAVMGRVDLRDLLARLGARGVQSILLEGGSELAGEALRAGLIDKCVLFYAPKFLGGAAGLGLFGGPSAERMDGCYRLKDVRVRRFGDDVMIEAYPEDLCLPGS
ncbi:bifunctional diaminohydroxyphosphoribosylaminopyrimidine deaminase/5-amino-6-(5-phosphoribosylamino)uracil reductase RibD [Geobacter grbiciae]|uniref:bifunctional diaminohydroxyphosphoribosylaminopyrimidine deaminase/5-amino-6-(5-phosphoribosylamino)uracil reductase RibD n=1 Tax=Geobacter grbiciae TaxID=155042 RepID=UPI001C018D0F|nr:bifunctional diaminohydroxyphosphoribosylaminopyrimidine deaminase/5-amino-6-(5-phosphoribosylamino)uracil reductase RibD [Geobacter grbiciae]MBT1075893.1 bifunctional diaminohydroxyphosphoribosylaminopyrimidine deaminase/5-amino-6-(5-phosphoribosylamino)uracil reductase RibD [Geobacter grbiciae]